MKKAHEQVTTGSSGSSGFPRAMVFAVSYVLSLVTGLYCHHRPQDHRLASLISASGYQDHTSSPHASHRSSPDSARVHRIPPRVRDDREPPLLRDGMGESIKLFLPNGEAKYFLKEGWTMAISDRALICPSSGKSACSLAVIPRRACNERTLMCNCTSENPCLRL
jgi:hypothetical protein